MRSGIIVAVFAFVLLAANPFLVCGQSSGPPLNASKSAPESFSFAREKLIERVANKEVPAFTVAVVRRSEIVWEEGIGWADREAGSPATSNTVFAVASISKSLTAAGLAVLEVNGRLKTSDAIAKYLGKKWIDSAGSETVTIAQILRQTSGIPHLFEYEYADDAGPGIDRNGVIRKYGFLASTPGSRFVYTNLGYSVLAAVVERAGEGSFDQVMKQEIFGPLGMANTSLSGWVGAKGFAQGYGRDDKPIGGMYKLSPDGGAGYFSSAHDLALYARYQLGTGVPKGMERATITSYLGSAGTGAAFYYDRGWGILSHKGKTFLISDGQMAGASSAIILVPGEDLAVVVLCNRTGGPALEAAGEILGAAVPGLGEAFGEAISEAEKWVAAPSEIPNTDYEGEVQKDGKRIPVKLRLSGEAPVLTIRGVEIRMRNDGWDRGALQLIAGSGLEKDAEEGEFRRMVFSVWPSGDRLEGFVMDELYDERPRRGLPYRVQLSKTGSTRSDQ